MSIILPPFKNTPCTIFTACGIVDLQGKLPPKRLNKECIAIYKAENQNAIIRLFQHYDKSSIRLHIDCALNKFFPNGEKPKRTHKVNEVKELIKYYFDLNINVNIKALFKIDLKKIPIKGLMKGLITKELSEEKSIKLIGSTFSFSKLPIKKLEWELLENNKQVKFIIESENTDIINKDYLLRSFKFIEEIFDFFILEKE